MLTDNQGSVRDVAQYSSGTSIVDHVILDSFGNATQGAGFTGDPLPEFGYDGMRLDAATGLDDDHARWYNAVNGVFGSEDPLGFGGGQTNLSEFAGNSPTSATDPSGLFATAGGKPAPVKPEPVEKTPVKTAPDKPTTNKPTTPDSTTEVPAPVKPVTPNQGGHGPGPIIKNPFYFPSPDPSIYDDLYAVARGAPLC
jgi:RHS repeat-associated protein